MPWRQSLLFLSQFAVGEDKTARDNRLTWLCLIHGDEGVGFGVQTTGFLLGRCLVFLLRRRAPLRLVRLLRILRANTEGAGFGTLVLVVLEAGGRLLLLLLLGILLTLVLGRR